MTTTSPLHAPSPPPGGSVEDRLRAVEDTLAVLQLEGAYSPAWDSGDADAWAALFTVDGVFELAQVGRSPAPRSGDATLSDSSASTSPPRRPGSIAQHSLDRAGRDEATARVHFEFRSGASSDTETRHAHVAGHYTVLYRRTPEAGESRIDGRWLCGATE
nr:hypothetical protein [Prescottella equi]